MGKKQLAFQILLPGIFRGGGRGDQAKLVGMYLFLFFLILNKTNTNEELST